MSRHAAKERENCDRFALRSLNGCKSGSRRARPKRFGPTLPKPFLRRSQRMNARKIVGGCMVMCGIVMAVGAALDVAIAHADQKGCCNPAHAVTPTPPAGASCTLGGEGCENTNCTGEAFQTAANGVCQKKNNSSCLLNMGTAPVSCHQGTWDCEETGEECTCTWTDGGQNSQVVQVPNCSGDGC
jgi:hypothetical protein